MSRKSVLLGLGILTLLVGVTTGTVFLLVKLVPRYYQQLAMPPGPQRQQYSEEFTGKCFHLWNGLTTEKEWEERFTDAQINSFFEEDFIQDGWKDQLLPENISQPRVAFDQGNIRLAFCYGMGTWCSTIITLDLRVWLVQAEANVVAVELRGLHAGSLPISAQSVMDRIEEVAHRQDIDVSWHRSDGHPVALLRFQANQTRPTVRLDRLILQKGEILIGGRSVEDAPLRAMIDPAKTLKPSAN